MEELEPTPQEAARAFLETVKETKTQSKPSWSLVAKLTTLLEESLDRERQLERAAGHLDDLIRTRDTKMDTMRTQHAQAIQDMAR